MTTLPLRSDQLLELDRRARRVRQNRVAGMVAVLLAVLLGSCGPSETEVRAGVPVSGEIDRAQLVPAAVVDPTGYMLALPATTTTTTTTTTVVAPHSHAGIVAPAPVPATADTQANRALGKRMAAEYGWTGEQWTCLDLLWSHESGWNHTVWNRQGSGAYGIPQSLPAHKMASHGADWRTNPATQIAWGRDYIRGRYGTPCGALNHSRQTGWY